MLRALIFILLSSACAHSGRKEPAPVAPEEVKILIQTDSQLNWTPERTSLPVYISFYALKSEVEEDLEFEAIHKRAKETLGDRLDGEPKTIVAYSARTMTETLRVGPEISHILAVAAFRDPIGTYWYQTYEIPFVRSTADSPCFFLYLERNEINGGPFPPPGFNLEAFKVSCPAVSARRPEEPGASKDAGRLKDRPSVPSSSASVPSNPPKGLASPSVQGAR